MPRQRVSSLQKVFFFTGLVATTGLMFWILQPFWAVIFWAIIFAIVFAPVERWWFRRFLKHQNLAALMATLTVIAVVLLPLFLIGSLVFNEARNFYSNAATDAYTGNFEKFDQVLAAGTDYLGRLGIDEAAIRTKLVGFAEAASGWLAREAFALGQVTFVFFLQLLLMLFILFYALRDGPAIVKTLGAALPFSRARESLLFNRIGSIVRAIMKGTILIALIQGTLGGLLFWIAGVPAPAVWGALMAVFAILPMVGPGVVWLPAGLILLAAGSVWQGVVVLAGGALAVSVIDNILRPIFVGRDTQIPNVVVFIASLGGLALFGVTGFVVGPVIAGLFLAFWGLFMQDYKKELNQ